VWHAVTPVIDGYDPILYESPEPKDVLVMNAGPANVAVLAWPEPIAFDKPAKIRLELFPGDQRILSGRLVRVQLLPSSRNLPPFAAVAWVVLPQYVSDRG